MFQNSHGMSNSEDQEEPNIAIDSAAWPGSSTYVDYKKLVMQIKKEVVKMIKLEVEVEDVDSGGFKTLTLPCNLRAELPDYYNYTILSCSPDISLSFADDIQKLNEVIDEINAENPGMTGEYLGILIEASSSGDIFDDEFLLRVKGNEFMFEDISAIKAVLTAEEIAGRYLSTTLKIPFDHGITEEMLDVLGDDALADYIDWEQIWEQYASIGFAVVERDGSWSQSTGQIQRKRYIVHVK